MYQYMCIEISSTISLFRNKLRVKVYSKIKLITLYN